MTTMTVRVCLLLTGTLVAAPAAAQAPVPAPLAAAAWRPQDPVPPYPYRDSVVSFTSAADGTRLEGTLTTPGGAGPFPAVLLLSGAGAQDRDYTVFGHRFFLVLADHLARRGIAVLRVDDRGAGRSAGNSTQATIAEAIGDVQAAVSLLRAHPSVKADRVGLIAHSEGGRVAPVAVGRSEGIAFLVMLAPPAVSAEELIARQATDAGADPATMAEAALLLMIRQRVQDEPDVERALARVVGGLDDWMMSLPQDQARVMRAVSGREPFRQRLAQLVTALATPWNRSLFALDPAPPLKVLDVPVLALYGDRDRQAPPVQNVPVLERHWASHRDATVRVLPGLNHFFQHAETGLPTEIPQIGETLAPSALEAIADWIATRFVRA
jgi:uncharacterized protein